MSEPEGFQCHQMQTKDPHSLFQAPEQGEESKDRMGAVFRDANMFTTSWNLRRMPCWTWEAHAGLQVWRDPGRLPGRSSVQNESQGKRM